MKKENKKDISYYKNRNRELYLHLCECNSINVNISGKLLRVQEDNELLKSEVKRLKEINSKQMELIEKYETEITGLKIDYETKRINNEIAIDRLKKDSTFAWSFAALLSFVLLISSIINILINS